MTDKEGESYIRTVLSHLTVMLIFCIMTLNLMLIFITLYKLPNPYTLIQQKVAEHKTVEIYSAPVIESTNPIETNNSYNFVEENIKNISLVEESLMISNDISLVDFMKSIGIEDTSFDNRAKIAEGLDVVDDKNLYQGSPKQNRDIVNKIKDEIISYLNNIQ